MRKIQGKFNKESFRINSDLKNVPEVKTNAVGRRFFGAGVPKSILKKKENKIPTAESLILAQDER